VYGRPRIYEEMNYTKPNLRTDVVVKGLFRGIIRQIKYTYSKNVKNIIKTIMIRAEMECDSKILELWIKAIGDQKNAKLDEDFFTIHNDYKTLKNLPSNYSMQRLKQLLSIQPLQVLFRAYLTEKKVERIIDSSKTMSKNREAYKEGAKLILQIICQLSSYPKIVL
jgi:hypothetical protein